MKLANDRVQSVLACAAVLLVLPALLAIPGDANVGDRAPAAAAIRAAEETPRAPLFYEMDGFCVCLHPDTDPETAEEILRNLPTYLGIDGMGKEAYNKAGRWSMTASGGTGVEGDPITLTWSFVPDGTTADGAPSTMYADFTAGFGGTGWITKIQQAFQRWDDVLGTTYIEVSDDGAPHPNSTGVLGVRGDCRLAGRSIDGAGNVLAYNYYP
ncbi:MAG: hypothetical protein EHM19_10040, partial [Candidatus Latescibacterota bacterium]